MHFLHLEICFFFSFISFYRIKVLKEYFQAQGANIPHYQSEIVHKEENTDELIECIRQKAKTAYIMRDLVGTAHIWYLME